MNEWIAFQRIADLRVAVDPSGEPDLAAAEIADVDNCAVRVPISIGAEADIGGAGAPDGFLGVLKAAARESVDRAVENADGAAPRRPPVAVRKACPPPAHSHPPFRVTGFLLQIALPDAPGVVVCGDFVPAGIAEESVVNRDGCSRGKFIA